MMGDLFVIWLGLAVAFLLGFILSSAFSSDKVKKMERDHRLTQKTLSDMIGQYKKSYADLLKAVDENEVVKYLKARLEASDQLRLYHNMKDIPDRDKLEGRVQAYRDLLLRITGKI